MEIQVFCKSIHHKLVNGNTTDARENSMNLFRGWLGNNILNFETMMKNLEDLMREAQSLSRMSYRQRGKSQFQRIYICLAACKIRFNEGCMPFIGLNACHIKIGNNIYPFAYALVIWTQFQELLSGNVGIENSQGQTLIFDKQNGLLNALDTVVPY